MSSTELTTQRLRILVQGIVQGVGFRPFVYRQALALGLVGYVLNNSQGVTIEIEGSSQAVDSFLSGLREQAPPLARVDSIAVEAIPLCYDDVFVINHSQGQAERTVLVSPDMTTCDDCLSELFNPTDRRYRYPFINCTNCGPRFTIIQDVPYDREKTTMRIFPLCPVCQLEYDDPLNRRFHAQPNACPVCGPHVYLLDLSDRNAESLVPVNDAPGVPFVQNLSNSTDPIVVAAQLLAGGALLAMKGLGGYHLVCDALNVEAVQLLRQRKHREAKPFALMVPNIETARLLCEVSSAEASLLQARQRPIVLLQIRTGCLVAPSVAAGYDTLGVMLPYTPLHHLLLQAFAAFAAGRPPALVMTSGNVSDEPIAYLDDDAAERLAPIATSLLAHNRTIHMRCDDSVMRIVADGEQFFRRSRGYAPEPLPLACDLPGPILACGGHLKNTFCLGKGKQAFVSHHIGDLENLATLTSFRDGIEHFQRLFDIHPETVAYDLHPEYLATKYALDTDIPRKIGVQHHHAHIASVIAEHKLSGQVIGVAADGTGFGTDGAVWGCEVMVADLVDFERLAHLTYVPLPGGEHAVRQPWRMAAAYLALAYGDAFLDLDIPFVRLLDRSKWRILAQMCVRGINCPPTSSLGRLFDAVAALTGLRHAVAYEGQAAIEFEILAAKATQGRCYPFMIRKNRQRPDTLDVVPMIRAIVGDIQQGVPSAQIANRFHRSIAEMLAQACAGVRAQSGLSSVALSGGVFQNRLLLKSLMTRLEEMAFQVYVNRRVPPNDGGISLGQLAVAAAKLQKSST